MKLRHTMAAALSLAMSAGAETVILQQGVNGYTGCTDKELREQNSNYNNKVAPSVNSMLVIAG